MRADLVRAFGAAAANARGGRQTLDLKCLRVSLGEAHVATVRRRRADEAAVERGDLIQFRARESGYVEKSRLGEKCRRPKHRARYRQSCYMPCADLGS